DWPDVFGAAAADGHDGGPLLRVLRRQAPGARAAHRQAGQIDPLRIDVVLLLDAGQDGQGPLPVVRVGLPGALLRLREDGQEGEAGRGVWGGGSDAAVVGARARGYGGGGL